MYLLKLKYLKYYLKSKIIKKISKKKFNHIKLKFINKINKKKFSNKWFLNNLEVFNYFISQKISKNFRYLEIGCFEGLSSYYVLSEYNDVNATLIDLWQQPNPNSKPLTNDFSTVEKNFDFNLAGFKFEKIKNDSVIAMRDLFKDNKKFDFIYIDGSHNGEDILSDAIEAYKILENNGIIFFDDFLQHDSSRLIQSYEGIEKFLSLYKNYIQILFFQNNLVLRKS